VNITVSPTHSWAIAFADRTGVQQLSPRMDGIGDRDQMFVEFAGRDLLEQLPVRRLQLPVLGR